MTRSHPRVITGRFALAAGLTALLAACGAHVLPEVHSEAGRLGLAKQLHARGDLVDAVELLKTYTTSGAGAADVDQAIYLLGDCYLGQKEWVLAAGEFERLLRDYPESDSSAAAAFRLGEAHFGQSRKEDFDQEYTVKAIDQWQSYLRGYPGHWLNGEAERRLMVGRTRLARKLLATGTLYLKLKRPVAARATFQRVIDEYDDTPAKPEAELGLALAEARAGQREAALAQLREIESRHAGTPIAERAARERTGLERRRN